MFDEENSPAPSTDYEDHHARNIVNIDIRQRDPLNPIRYMVKVEPKDEESIDLTKE